MFVSPVAKMCTNKRAYVTLKHAMYLAKRRGQRYYVCPRCKFYHLTTKGCEQPKELKS